MRRWLLLFGCLLCGVTAWAGEAEDFFEARIRPVLVEHCYECHSAKSPMLEAGLRLDTAAGTAAGGDSGRVIVPGKPAESPLLQALHYRDDIKMPPRGKLSPQIIADFEQWIRTGAVDPRGEPAASAKPRDDWAAVFAERKSWWSFQPLAKPALPAGDQHPVDTLLAEETPGPRADRATLLRRLSYVLTGLPPTLEELGEFERDTAPQAYERAVDRLLASPRYGERWATLWLDLMRYAESHNSEGDPPIPEAWRYRDYIIRALNSDVPYDQLLREHLAGDLLPNPRPGESIIGPAALRFMEHGFQPVETREELAKTIDNQIDVLSKAFLGLTVTCARCHDHKFDAISQHDYTALYGIFASLRPAMVTVETTLPRAETLREIDALKARLKPLLAEAWADDVAALAEKLPALTAEKLKPWSENRQHPLHAWAKLHKTNPDKFAKNWAALLPDKDPEYKLLWDLRKSEDLAQWTQHGQPLAPTKNAEFALTGRGKQLLAGIYPRGVYSHLQSSKLNSILASPRFKITTDRLGIRMVNNHRAGVRLIIDNYPLGYLSTFPQNRDTHETLEWVLLDTNYRKGAEAYLELATYDDTTVRELPANGSSKTALTAEDGRSWFGVTEIVQWNGDFQAPTNRLLAANQSPANAAELAAAYQAAATRAVEHWQADKLDDNEALLLNALLQAGLLRNSGSEIPAAQSLDSQYRSLDKTIAIPTRVPGVLESTGRDAPLHVRGNPKLPGAVVPRRNLEIFGGAPITTTQSGRLELAEALTRDNPLVLRVVVNRIWQGVFGRGLVATPDNFGKLGELPTHAALLDDLARRFASDGQSLKRMIKLLVLSEHFQQRDQPVRRLDAEQIRDAFLSIAGELNPDAGGPGRWNPPLDDGRRSLYVRVRRSEPQPFLAAFDKPTLSAPRGKRDVTTQPTQALALLNSPFVIELSQRWGQKLAKRKQSPSETIRTMYLAALSREPSPAEAERALAYLEAAAAEAKVALTDARPWQDFAHALFCLPETINLR